ncbi:TIGR02391 family protein [Actinoplanes sp. NPDC051411]|jgi:uncharacterized protein (TIGR02391 family)|uniref:TIGR02391 family protein n=1 Tax=Actinoplanes sp. NPDC051411 TaxID=3155522 RepID=UPI003415A235
MNATGRTPDNTAWPPAVVQSVTEALASTKWPGLSNNEIEQLLAALSIPDVLDASNKRSRLCTALLHQQQQDGTNDAISRFLTEAMTPARYLRDPARFEELRKALAPPLSLLGLEITAQGRLGPAIDTATTLDDVARITGRLRYELKRRGVHTEVIRYCDQELIRQSLYHAIFEATKGVSERLRQMSGLPGDGAQLLEACFGPASGPLLRINAYTTESDQSEQRGFVNLVKGIFGTFRNPAAHTTRASLLWNPTEADTLDLFSMLSFVHRCLDQARAEK